MLTDFGAYIWAVFVQSRGIYSLATFVPGAFTWVQSNERVANVIEYIDRHVITLTNRRRFYRFLLIAGITFASFLAWDEQYKVANSRSSQELAGRVEGLQRYLDQAQRESKQQDAQILKLHTDLDATESLLKTMQKQNRLEIAGDQMKTLLATLDHVPLGQTYYVDLEVERDCMDCEVFANNLTGAWGHLRGWHLRGRVNRRATL